MFRIIRSEIFRLRHILIISSHILIALLYALIFLIASFTTTLKNFKPEEVNKIFFVLLTILIPALTGMVTSKALEVERSCCSFQVLLSETKSRTKAYLGKLIVLIMLFSISICISVGFFGLLYEKVRLSIYLFVTILVLISAPTCYMIHLLLTLVRGGGFSIVLGFLETLFSCLFLTGLGDGIWYFFPASWPSRLVMTYLSAKHIRGFFHSEMIKWIPAALVLNALILFFFYRIYQSMGWRI